MHLLYEQGFLVGAVTQAFSTAQVDLEEADRVIIKWGEPKLRVQEDNPGADELCGFAFNLSLADRCAAELVLIPPIVVGANGKWWELRNRC